jgi:hypothetical protein
MRPAVDPLLTIFRKGMLDASQIGNLDERDAALKAIADCHAGVSNAIR